MFLCYRFNWYFKGNSQCVQTALPLLFWTVMKQEVLGLGKLG